MKGLVDAFPDVELEKDINAVWRMESPFVWYVTFKHKACAEYLDSIGEYCHNNKKIPDECVFFGGRPLNSKAA